MRPGRSLVLAACLGAAGAVGCDTPVDRMSDAIEDVDDMSCNDLFGAAVPGRVISCSEGDDYTMLHREMGIIHVIRVDFADGSSDFLQLDTRRCILTVAGEIEESIPVCEKECRAIENAASKVINRGHPFILDGPSDVLINGRPKTPVGR